MSGPHTVTKAVQWTLIPDRERESAPVTHAMECATCPERSDASGEWEPPQWALGHARSNPTHRSFREVMTRPWRAQVNP